MTSPETTPANPQRADPGPLEPGEIDFSGATCQPDDLADVIGDAFVEAEASGGELPEWGARAIARSLADRHGESAAALHEFAASGEGDLEAISREAMPIYNQPDCSPWARKQLDYLLTFLLNRGKAADTAPAPLAESAPGTADEILSPQAIQGSVKVLSGLRGVGWRLW